MMDILLAVSSFFVGGFFGVCLVDKKARQIIRKADKVAWGFAHAEGYGEGWDDGYRARLEEQARQEERGGDQ